MFHPTPTQRIVVGTTATLAVIWIDQDGEPDNTTRDVTVTITRTDGTVIVADGGTIDDRAATVGRFTHDLTAATNQQLGLLTAVWDDGTSTISTLIEVVGGVYFTVAEARAAISSLTDANYPTAAVIQARRDVEDEFERICAVAFVPRYRQITLASWGNRCLYLPDMFVRNVRTISTSTGTFAQTAAVQISAAGELSLETGVFPYSRYTTIAYEHGFDRPPPEIKAAAFTRLRERINMDTSGIPARATSWQDVGGGGYRLDTAGFEQTGNPEVDAALARHNYRTIGVA